jgi:restriction endonuclease BglII
MKTMYYSYRYAEEILQHENYKTAWDEIHEVISSAPLFVYKNKSKKNTKLDVVQQVMNTYFDRRVAIDLGWEFHPLATDIQDSKLKADFRKKFGDLTVQAEVQFGNMSRWYSDIFKLQTAYSTKLINLGLCVVPQSVLAKRIDSNIANFERARRELPSADLSITLPILLVGISPDKGTPVVDLSGCQFSKIGDITGQGKTENRWRIVNGYLNGRPMSSIGANSPTGPMPPKKLLRDAENDEPDVEQE